MKDEQRLQDILEAIETIETYIVSSYDEFFFQILRRKTLFSTI
jgi:uncharacterized protein with HEPN domain